jgi:hypothetical protein
MGYLVEAPARPETVNEAIDVRESQRCARSIRVPSRGSPVSLVSWFAARRSHEVRNSPLQPDTR